MKIEARVYSDILKKCISPPPEMGGILGEMDGVVTHYALDRGLPGNHYDEYIPDVNYLNEIIAEWSDCNIEFCGLFHTHFKDGDRLSNADKKYIYQIMQSTKCEFLYFPLIIPDRTMIAYKAKKRRDQLILTREDIELICNWRRET